MIEVSTDDPQSENDIQKWEGYEQIKNFYCMPEIPIDYDKLSRARLRYWDMNRHLYDDNRLIQIDTHRPSDMGVEKATPMQVEQSFKHWAIKHGPRDVLASSVVNTNQETKCEERKAFLKDKSEGLAKDKKIAELLALVEKLSKAVDQKTKSVSVTKQTTAKTPSVVVPAAVVDNVSIGKKRPFLADYRSPANLSIPSPPAATPPIFHSYPSNPPPPVHVFSQHNVSTAALNTDNNSQQLQWAEELRQKAHEVSLKEKRVQALQLDIDAARKELALRAIQQEKDKAQARSDLELQVIHADKREVLYAAKQRQQFLHDQDHAIRYQQISEDRLFTKEAVRRQWQVEDRETENQARRNQNRDAMDMATRANETAVLQSLLVAQKQQWLPFSPPPPPPFPPSYYYPMQQQPQFHGHHHQPGPLLPSPISSPAFDAHRITSPVVGYPPMPKPAATPSSDSIPSSHSTPSQKYGISVQETPANHYHQEPAYKESSMEWQQAGFTTEPKSLEDMTVEEIQLMLSKAQSQLNEEFANN